MEDSNFHSSLKSIAGEAVPYFSQLSSRRDGAGTLQQEDASRHVYAARLEELPSGVRMSPVLSRQSPEESPIEGDCIAASSCSDGFEYPPAPLKEDSPLEARIRRYNVCQCVCGSVRASFTTYVLTGL